MKTHERTAGERIARDYLRRLQEALAGAPPADAARLHDQIRTHLDELLETDPSESHIRTALDQLGTPAQLASEVITTPSEARGRGSDICALLLLSVGSLLLPFVGWIAGAVLLVSSPRFTRVQKIAAIVVWPFGLLTPAAMFLLVATPSIFGTHSLGVPAGLCIFLAPVAVILWLAGRLR